MAKECAGHADCAQHAFSHVRKETARLNVYASLKADENVKIGANQERQQAAQSLETLVGAKTAWLAPEVLSVGADKIHTFEKQSPELAKRFGFFLENILRGAPPHAGRREPKAVLAQAGDVMNQPDNIFSQLANGEIALPDG